MLIATSNFLVPGPTFVVELVIFLVVLWALAKYVLPYANRMIEARQQTIERNLNEAEEAKARAQELEEQRAHQLAQGREEARRLRDEAAKVGEQLRQDLQKKGEEDYQRLMERATADIEASARRAAEDLRAQVSDLVIAVVERVLRDGMSVGDQQRLVDQAISEVEALSTLEGVAPAAASGAAAPAGGAGG